MIILIDSHPFQKEEFARDGVFEHKMIEFGKIRIYFSL